MKRMIREYCLNFVSGTSGGMSIFSKQKNKGVDSNAVASTATGSLGGVRSMTNWVKRNNHLLMVGSHCEIHLTSTASVQLNSRSACRCVERVSGSVFLFLARGARLGTKKKLLPIEPTFQNILFIRNTTF